MKPFAPNNNGWLYSPLSRQVGFLLLFLLLTYTISAQEQYLKATLDEAITIAPESSLHLGNITTNSISLDQIPINENGYVNFTFSGLTAADNVSISLENETGAIYYKMQFSNNEASLSDNTGTNFLLSTNARNNSLFSIKKCGNSIIWSDEANIPILIASLDNPAVLFAKVTVENANNVSLDLVFNTGSEVCEKCTTIAGASLFPGDVMFTGYDNASSGNKISIKALAPIPTGTTFSLMQGSYTASNNRWYAPSNNGNIAIQKITYVGTNTLPIGTTICLILPTSGTGEALLANSFSINGSISTDFCVENVGNTINPRINLSANTATALFLVQGAWKLLDAHGEFSGRVLSGLQYGGNWRVGISPSSGLSNIPPDIECMAIEDGLNPSTRHAYHTRDISSIASITDFSNWQTGSGALPSAACGGAAAFVASQARNTTAPITQNTAHFYPNPFKKHLTLQLDLVEAQAISLDIYDSSGRIIHHQAFVQMDAGTNQIPLSFPTGTSDVVFWTRIQLAEEIIVKRIVKQGLSLN